jgi:hypothetical protein
MSDSVIITCSVHLSRGRSGSVTRVVKEFIVRTNWFVHYVIATNHWSVRAPTIECHGLLSGEAGDAATTPGRPIGQPALACQASPRERLARVQLFAIALIRCFRRPS